jgi:carbamoyltransferase
MKRDVIVLGIHDGHEASAALIKNGEVIAAIAEERLTNVKNQYGSPINSIRKVFEISGVNPADVNIIAIASLIKLQKLLVEQEWKNNLNIRVYTLLHSHTFAKLFTKILHKFRDMTGLNELFVEFGLEDKETAFIEHHRCHAACAYYQRPWNDDTLVLTLDGAGDYLSSTVNLGRELDMERIASTLSYDSLSNNLYSEITGFLGLKRWEHEYKVMGMAPYGRAEYCIEAMRNIVRVNPAKPLEFQNISGAYAKNIQKKLRRVLAEQRFDNITAACQQHFEETLTLWVINCIKETGINKIACAGGAFLNVKANKLIREMEEVEDVFFYPACGDGGLSVGAALEAYHRYCERDGLKPMKISLKDLYYGMEYTDERIEKILKEKGLIEKAEYIGDIEGAIGEMLANGKVIARFKGRDEWGPRALGNRSILADPRDLRVIRKINFAIKHRDFWMPFTPSMLEERSSDYLINARPARYMIEAFDTNEKAEEIIAALHPFDRTARPQTVNEWNTDYRKIIEDFQNRTGIGGVLNTSFNLHGYPIVGTPERAIETLEKSGLDGLAIGNWMVRK